MKWARFFEAGRLPNKFPYDLRQLALSFRYRKHELTNNGIYTHEIYPFTGDSRRCYLIKSGETYTLKKIGAHL